METYTELQETATEKASIDSVDTEKVKSVNEGVFFFKNQAVLDKLDENDKNELTYKNKALAYKQIKGQIIYPSSDWFYLSSFGNCYMIVDLADAFQEGTKILDIEFLTAVGWLSITSMFKLDGIPYTVFMDRVFFDLGEPALAMVYFPEGINSVFSALNEGAIEQMRVTFLPKTEEVADE